MGGLSVLVISEVYWPEGSGGELATHLWVEALAREGVKVTVVTGTGAPARAVGAEYVILEELRVSGRAALWKVLKGLNQDLRSLVRDSDLVYVPRLAWPAVATAKEVGKAAVLHLHDYAVADPSGFVLAEGAPGASRASVLGPVGLLKYLASKRFWEANVKYALMADAYVCVSRRQLEIISSLIPSISEKLRYVPNPLPPRSAEVGELPLELNKPYLVFPGGRSKLKGYHIVSEVSKALKGEVEVVITKAPTKEVVRKGGVTYVPRVRHGDYLALLRSSLALLHPSIWEEPMPYAVVEAVALKVPVIATAVGGVPEILGKDYPLLVNPKNPVEGCVAAVKKLMSEEEPIKEKVERLAQELKERLKPEKLVKNLIKVFEEVARKYS